MINSRPFYCVASLLLSTVLSSCAHYQAKPLDLSASQQTISTRSLNDAALQQRLQSLHLMTADKPADEWNRAQLLVIAAERNSKLLIARAQLQAASAAIRTAQALPNPTLSLGSEYSLSQTSESPWLWSLTTDWLVDAGLRRQLRIQLADTQVRAVRLDYAEALWSVRSELRRALLSYLLSAQRGVLLTDAVTDQERLVNLQRQRVRLGEAAATDALQVELDLAHARSALATNTRAYAVAQAQLAAALGLPLSSLQQQRFTWDDLIHVTPLDEAQLSKLRDSALLARTDLERAVLDYQSRDLELQQAIRQQYPQLSVGPGYTWDHGVHKATLGVSFTLPIFNRNQGPIAEAEAARNVSGEQAMAVQSQVLNEIDAARQTYQLSVQSLQTVVQQSDVTDTLLQQATRAMNAGAADQVTVLSARVAANTQSLAVLDAVEVMQQTLGQLEDALRTPLSGPELNLGKTVWLDAPAQPATNSSK